MMSTSWILQALLSATASTASAEATAPASDPTTVALLALERKAQQAYFKGDAAFFEEVLSDRFVMLGPDGSRQDKAATTRMIAGVECEVRDGWTLDEPRLSKIHVDTYVFTYRGTWNGTCLMDGANITVPSPVRAATLWIRSGDSWRAAFHGENPIFDPRATAAPSAKPGGQMDAVTGDAMATPIARPAASTADPETVAMVAIEASVWEAWKSHDRETLEQQTASELAFVDIFGNVTSGKPETINLWAGNECDVTSVDVVDGLSSSVSPAVGILTFKGILGGTCGGQKFPVIHGTSVYVKEGDAWKLAFTLNHLTS